MDEPVKPPSHFILKHRDGVVIGVAGVDDRQSGFTPRGDMGAEVFSWGPRDACSIIIEAGLPDGDDLGREVSARSA